MTPRPKNVKAERDRLSCLPRTDYANEDDLVGIDIPRRIAMLMLGQHSAIPCDEIAERLAMLAREGHLR